MTKKLIYQKAVIKVAKELVLTDRHPTVAAIRSRLQSGSETTIYKYLSQWKQECFKKAIDNSNCFTPQLNQTIDLEEKRNLEQTLNKHVAQNEYYAQELINAEKTNISLKEQNHQLQTTIQELQLKLSKAETINNTLEQVNQKIQNRLDINDSNTISKMQQTIATLHVELKTLNETSLSALRDTSTKGHEALMQEKVTSINLQTKIDSLNKELMDNKHQSHDAGLKHQVQTQTLLRQINWQQKIIQDHIDNEKLRELIGEQELMLNFNNKLGAAYGK